MIQLDVATLGKGLPLPARRALIRIICRVLNEALSGLGLVVKRGPSTATVGTGRLDYRLGNE